MNRFPDRRFCVAPMMKCTDRYFRRLARVMTRRAMLYTEMLSCKAVIHGNAAGILDFTAIENPLGLQIGGRDPAAMAQCAELAQQWDYAEININAGCPSQCAQSGGFGAWLMKEPEHLAACVSAITAAAALPVSIKCRIGVEGCATDLLTFVERNARAGCGVFIVHARTALLDRSPKHNRTIPPLDYDCVYRLKERFPECEIIINGGIQSLQQAQEVCGPLDGVMLGRAAYRNPLMLTDVDRLFYGAPGRLSERELTEAVLGCVRDALLAGAPPGTVFKHLLNLFKGRRNAKQWRRRLGEYSQVEMDATRIGEMLHRLRAQFHRLGGLGAAD